MLVWFAGCAVVAVWVVLRDPKVDYRLVAAGALVPDAVDLVLGGPRALHTLLGSVLVLGAVMAATVNRRELRKRALALPFGTFLHLLLDGLWTDRSLFWWPFFGSSFGDGGLPSFERPVSIVVAQEVAGLVVFGLWARTVGLTEPARRRHFVKTGHLLEEGDDA